MTDTDQFSDDLIKNIPYLRVFAKLLVKDHHLAEDVVQDTLVRAWACRSQFQPGTNLRGWLTVILRNRYFNIRRRRAFQSEILIDDELLGHGVTGGQFEHLEFQDFEKAFETLPEEQQKALALVGFHGLTYEEAAEIVECMVGTMKSRVCRARAHLLEVLDGA